MTTMRDDATPAATMIDLLRGILAELRTANARRRGKTAEYVRGDGTGPKPCLVCALRESCQSPCMGLDEWKAASGLTKARPGHRQPDGLHATAAGGGR